MKKILIVDDEKNVSISISIGLSRHGYKVETANNGQDAIMKMRKTVYDYLITDVRMPKMNGFELTKIAHKIYPSIAIVLMSAYDFNEIIEQYKELIRYPRLCKPFEIIDLISIIENDSSYCSPDKLNFEHPDVTQVI